MTSANLHSPANVPSSRKIIPIAAALILRPDGQTLLVRKRGTTAYMQPGGKLEPGESPIAALVRELQEELDLTVDAKELAYLGTFLAPAANEPDCLVHAEVFRLHTNSPVQPAAEIEEIIWIDPANPGNLHLAPLTRDHVFKLPAIPPG